MKAMTAMQYIEVSLRIFREETRLIPMAIRIESDRFMWTKTIETRIRVGPFDRIACSASEWAILDGGGPTAVRDMIDATWRVREAFEAIRDLIDQ